MISMDARVARQPDVVWRKIGDEMMLVPIHSRADDMESIFTLNETAALIWSLLDGERRLSDVRQAILAEYDADPQQVEADILELVQQWLEVKVISVVE